jgi:hypothetical protein
MYIIHNKHSGDQSKNEMEGFDKSNASSIFINLRKRYYLRTVHFCHNQNITWFKTKLTQCYFLKKQ